VVVFVAGFWVNVTVIEQVAFTARAPVQVSVPFANRVPPPVFVTVLPGGGAVKLKDAVPLLVRVSTAVFALPVCAP
jgi:hypothetical protein